MATKPISDNVAKTIIPGRQAMSDTHRELYFARWDARNRLVTGGASMFPGPAGAPLRKPVAERLQWIVQSKARENRVGFNLGQTAFRLPAVTVRTLVHDHPPSDLMTSRHCCNPYCVATAERWRSHHKSGSHGAPYLAQTLRCSASNASPISCIEGFLVACPATIFERFPSPVASRLCGTQSGSRLNFDVLA